MANAVTLTVLKGNLPQQEYRFEQRDHVILGRLEECGLQIPNAEANKMVSRFHCSLDIVPPRAVLCDYGSRNGTFLNGQLIGKREDNESPEEGHQRKYPERLLSDGDIIRLADAIELKVKIEKEEGGDAGLFETGRLGGLAAIQVAYHTKKAQALVSSNIQAALKDYDLLKELGKGGSGAVYLATHRSSGEKRAIKIMVPENPQDLRARREFEQELAVSQTLQHENIVHLYDALQHDTFFALIMEYCDGGDTHHKMIQQKRRYSPQEAVGITLQVLDALIYAHTLPVKMKDKEGIFQSANGIVHRDIKPSNILLHGPQQVVKLADFGLAKAFDLAGMSGLSRSGIGRGYAPGTLQFMSRVQCARFKYSKPDVDVWATAASLYFLLTGTTPRDFNDRTDPYDTILNTNPLPIRSRRRDIPEKLAEVIDAALVDKPAIKVGSAEQLRRALERVAL